MLEMGDKLVNKSDLRMRPLGKNDFFEFRRAATESTETNYEDLAYGELFENDQLSDEVLLGWGSHIVWLCLGE
jgi:hypothetical protein